VEQSAPSVYFCWLAVRLPEKIVGEVMDTIETFRRLIDWAEQCLVLLERLGEIDRGTVIDMRADIDAARVALQNLPRGKS